MEAAGFYLFYIINWIITLLPLKILYLFSDFLYLLLYYFPGYRRDVVRTNLKNSFPEKSELEIKIIERGFYRHLADLFVESLKLTHRRELFASRVDKIRNGMPYAGIGADIIAGFPGESESDFEETFSFLEKMPLSYLHVFSFSERPGTVAQTLPLKVAPAEKEIRSKRLIRLSEDKNLKFNELNINRITDVLFERSGAENLITGFTGNYIRVEYPRKNLLAGEIKKVRLTGLADSGNMTIELLS